MPYEPEGRPCQAPAPHNGFTYDTPDGRCLCLLHVVKLRADMSPTTEARLADIDAAAAYLSQYLADGDWHRPESHIWFKGLGDYVASLELTDPRILAFEECLRPILDDDEALDGHMMYPQGAAVAFLESRWGGDHDPYLSGFVDALRQDYAAWVRALDRGLVGKTSR